MPAKLDVVEVLLASSPEHEHLLVLRPVEAALSGVGLDPDRSVEMRAIDRATGLDQLSGMPPIHAHEVDRPVPGDADCIAERLLQEGDELLGTLLSRGFGERALPGPAAPDHAGDADVVG